MADHTLLMGVQAALDRRLRNRALDLQSQVAESQMGDRDQREQDMRMKIVQQHNDATAARMAKAYADANKPDPNAWRMPVEQERTTRAFGVQDRRGEHGDYQAETRAGAQVESAAGHDEASTYGADKRLEGTKYATDHKKFAPPRPAGGSGTSIDPVDREIMDLEKQATALHKSIYGGDAGQAGKFVPESMRAPQTEIKGRLEKITSRIDELRRKRDSTSVKSDAPARHKNP